MLNQDRYKTVEERVRAFRNYCNPIVGNCGTRCRLSEPDKSGGYDMLNCFAYWLTLEAKSDIEPCPFCGYKCVSMESSIGDFFVGCGRCYYRIGGEKTQAAAISAHNRVCRAVKAYKESEVKE